MAENPDNTERRSRLVLDRDQFDDYWIALLAKIRFNEGADRLLSGQSQHPLINYQQNNANSLNLLRILPFTPQQLFEDPVGCYVQFSRSLDTALQVFPAAVPALDDLNVLDDMFRLHKQADIS